MYLRQFRIRDIKCFEDVQLHFPHDSDDYSGWVVLLGGNGMGKSTLLQAMAISLVGPLAGQRLLNPDGWVREDKKLGSFVASIIKGDRDIASGQPRRRPYETSFTVTGRNLIDLRGIPYDQPQLILTSDTKDQKGLMSGPYAARKTGWFSCGYGPFRRLLGGASEVSQLMFSTGRESRFVTLFREAAALTQCTEWLSSLYSRSIDPNHPDKERAMKAYEVVRRVIDDLLPDPVRLCRITTERVLSSAWGCRGRCAGPQRRIPELPGRQSTSFPSRGINRRFLALVSKTKKHACHRGRSDLDRRNRCPPSSDLAA